MPLSHFFHPQARVEHLEQVAYYETRAKGLGPRYLLAFDAAIERICRQPSQFPVLVGDIRHLRLQGFPLDIVYREAADGIEVLAMAHHKRRPGYWASRSGTH